MDYGAAEPRSKMRDGMFCIGSARCTLRPALANDGDHVHGYGYLREYLRAAHGFGRVTFVHRKFRIFVYVGS